VTVWAEIERISGKADLQFRQQAFTQIALVVNRKLKRAENYSVQLAADGWAGGDEPYVSVRLEGCREVRSEKHSTQFCSGLGAYHETGGTSPVAAISAHSEFWQGRVSSYASFERAFRAPTFSYYHADLLVQVAKLKRVQLSAGFVSRTIQPAAGKFAVQLSDNAQGYVTAGSGRATVGLSFSF
jgi:hypothetical protein